jgi:tetratricopeptide (TPR) repeat protein
MKNRWFTSILFTLALASIAAAPSMGATDKLARADAALQDPNLDLAQARMAQELYESLLPAVADQTYLLEKLARVYFIMGDLTENKYRRQEFYDKGRTYANRLLQAQPKGVQGHYWQALHLCGTADAGGARVGMQLLPRIVDELEETLALDELYDQAGAHRVLGRIYFEAPAWPLSVGDMNKSLRHLTRAVYLAPGVSTNHLYLAEALIRLGKYDQARRELDAAIKSHLHAVHPGGLEGDYRKARKLLKELEGKPDVKVGG